MGLFASLFSSNVHEKPSSNKETLVLTGLARFDHGILGEERFQDSLEALCGPRVAKGVNQMATAWLVLEDKTSQDRNGVRVEIRGRQVGYLTPNAAVQFRRQLKAKNMPNANGQCQAVIRGGWLSSDGRKGAYEVWLDMLLSLD